MITIFKPTPCSAQSVVELTVERKRRGVNLKVFSETLNSNNELYIKDRKFEIIVASDVARDGLGIELWDRDVQKMLLEIFRHDDKKELIFSSYKSEIPFELVERFIREFEDRVGHEFQNENFDDETG